jgi:hypothetical protein
MKRFSILVAAIWLGAASASAHAAEAPGSPVKAPARGDPTRKLAVANKPWKGDFDRNIYKYYVGYKLTRERLELQEKSREQLRGGG